MFGFNITKRLLKVEKVIGKANERREIQAIVTLPIKAIKVFDIVVAITTDIQGEIRANGVIVAGVVRQQIFVVDEKEVVRHVLEEIPFQQLIEVSGAVPDQSAQINARVIDSQTHLIDNGRKIKQVIVLEFYVKVTEVRPIEVIENVKGGPTDLKVEKKLLRVDNFVGEERVSEAIKKEVKLPITAQNIFQVFSEVSGIQVKAKTGLIIVRGVLYQHIFLIDVENKVRHVNNTIPFFVSVPLETRTGMEVQVYMNAVVNKFELVNSPSKNLRQSILIDILAIITETQQVDVALDIRGSGVEVERKLLKIEPILTDVNESALIDTDIKLPMKAKKVFKIFAEIKDVQTHSNNENLIIGGVLYKKIYFVDFNGLLRHMKEEIPFQIILNVPEASPDMTFQVRLTIVGEIAFQLIDRRVVRQTAIVEALVKITETQPLEVAVDVIWRIPKKYFNLDL